MNTEEALNKCIAPLPYLYDSEDNRVVGILGQATNMCGITLRETEEREVVSEDGSQTTTETIVTQDGEDPATVWGRIWQVIRLLSSLSCWTDTDDDTFILQCRSQRTTAQQICGCAKTCCNCDDDAIVVPLEYAPTPERPFVGGTISVVINGRLVKSDISAEYLNEHYDHGAAKLYIMRDDFPNIMYYRNRCCCLCRRNLTITLEYNAGHSLIPAGILPLICPILSKVMSSQMSLSQCSSTMTNVAGLLRRKKTGSVEYEWSDKDSNASATEAIMTDIFNTGLIAELQAISRCVETTTVEELGDVI